MLAPIYQFTRCHIGEDCDLHNHRLVNLKSHIITRSTVLKCDIHEIDSEVAAIWGYVPRERKVTIVLYRDKTSSCIQIDRLESTLSTRPLERTHASLSLSAPRVYTTANFSALLRMTHMLHTRLLRHNFCYHFVRQAVFTLCSSSCISGYGRSAVIALLF